MAPRSPRGGGVQRAAGDLERRQVAELFPAHHAAACRLQGRRRHQLVALRRQRGHLAAVAQSQGPRHAGDAVLQRPQRRDVAGGGRSVRQVRSGRRRPRLAAGPDAVLHESGPRARDHQEDTRHPGEDHGQTPDRLGDADLRLVGEHHRLSRRGEARLVLRRARRQRALPTANQERPDRDDPVERVRR